MPSSASRTAELREQVVLREPRLRVLLALAVLGCLLVAVLIGTHLNSDNRNGLVLKLVACLASLATGALLIVATRHSLTLQRATLHALDAQRALEALQSTRAHSDCALIEITDSGPGTPASVDDRIFDPFFTTKPLGKGTGQGLSIARSIVVDKHQGTIGVRNEADAGATFSIRLPLRATHVEAA